MRQHVPTTGHDEPSCACGQLPGRPGPASHPAWPAAPAGVPNPILRSGGPQGCASARASGLFFLVLNTSIKIEALPLSSVSWSTSLTTGGPSAPSCQDCALMTTMARSMFIIILISSHSIFLFTQHPRLPNRKTTHKMYKKCENNETVRFSFFIEMVGN